MNQLKAGAFLNYVVIGLNTLVGLLYTPYMLRMLGQSEYGLYSIVASIIAYLTVLDLGFGFALVRYTAKYRAEGKIQEQYNLFGMFLLLYLGIGVIALTIGLGLYFNVDNMFGDTMSLTELEHARIMMLILVFNLAITFPMSIFGSVIVAYERFVFPKLVSIICITSNTLIMVILLSMGFKAIAMVMVQTIFNVITLFSNFLYCKYKLHIKICFTVFDKGLLKEIAVFSFWIFLNVIMDKIYWSTGQFVLGAMVGTAAVAIFAVAIQFHSMFMLFSSAISSVFLPKVTGMVTLRSKDEQISTLFIRTGRIQNIIIISVLLGFVIFGKQFIILWAGPNYSDAYIITLLFYASLYIPMIQSLGVTILQARNQMKFRSLLYLFISVFALFLQVIFAKIYGGIGCAVVIAAAHFVGQGLIMNIYYKRKQCINILQFWKEIFKMDIAPIIVSVLFGGVLMILDVKLSTWPSLLICIIVFMLFYIPTFFIYSLNEEERYLIIKPIKSAISYFEYK